MRKKMALISFLFGLTGCPNQGSNSSQVDPNAQTPQTLQGLDLSGTYNFLNVSCISGWPSQYYAGSGNYQHFQSQIVIDKNTLTQVIQTLNCEVNLSADVVFSDKSYVTTTNYKVTQILGGSTCDFSLTTDNANFLPQTQNFNFSVGPVTDLNTLYRFTNYLTINISNVLMIENGMSDQVNGDICFDLYKKQ